MAKREKKEQMRGFWVKVEDNSVTSYLLAAPTADAAKEIVEDLDMESVKKLALGMKVESSRFGVIDVTEASSE